LTPKTQAWFSCVGSLASFSWESQFACGLSCWPHEKATGEWEATSSPPPSLMERNPKQKLNRTSNLTPDYYRWYGIKLVTETVITDAKWTQLCVAYIFLNYPINPKLFHTLQTNGPFSKFAKPTVPNMLLLSSKNSLTYWEILKYCLLTLCKLQSHALFMSFWDYFFQSSTYEIHLPTAL
jgi:hypothetical protein